MLHKVDDLSDMIILSHFCECVEDLLSLLNRQGTAGSGNLLIYLLNFTGFCLENLNESDFGKTGKEVCEAEKIQGLPKALSTILIFEAFFLYMFC